jgi:hypothetical protein
MLLAGVTLGLAAMHTLGHAGMNHATTAGSSHGAFTHSPASMPLTGAMTTVGAMAAAFPQPEMVLAPTGGDRDADGWVACLAVLGTAALLLLLASVARRCAGTPPLDARRGAAPRSTRAPPGRLGLLLADLSVVRT